jgi:hypothetical protein
LSTLSMQSSTVTRAMETPQLLKRAAKWKRASYTARRMDASHSQL